MDSRFASTLERLKSEIGERLSNKLRNQSGRDDCLFPLMKAINDSPALPDIRNLREFAREILQIKVQTFEDLKTKCTDDNQKNLSRQNLVSVQHFALLSTNYIVEL